MEFHERLIAERQDHDESQRDLAKAIGTSQVMIWKYETNQSDMPIRILKEICYHYKVSADYLLGIPYNYRKPR